MPKSFNFIIHEANIQKNILYILYYVQVYLRNIITVFKDSKSNGSFNGAYDYYYY